MGTSDTWPDDSARAGGVGTMTRPAADPATGAAPAPGVRRGGPGRPDAPSRLPPQRTGRRRPARHGEGGRDRGGRALAPDIAPRRAAADVAPPAAARHLPRHTQRMPFFLLLCGLLGGALISALMISTTLAAGSFQITRLQQTDSALARQRQALEDQVARAQSAGVIEQRALQLGMRPVTQLKFIDLKSGKIETNEGTGAVRYIHVPGYTP